MNIHYLISLFETDLRGLQKSNHTIRNYRYDLHKFYTYIRINFPRETLDESTLKQACVQYGETLHTYEDGDKTYDEASLNRKRSTLRSFIRFCFRFNYIKRDFSQEIEFQRTKAKPLHDILDWKETEMVLRILNRRIRYAKDVDMKFMHRRNRLAYLALLHTGMKVSELVSLSWASIKDNSMEISIFKPRGKERRIVPFNLTLKRAFTDFKQSLQELPNFSESYWNGYIFFGVGSDPARHLNVKTIERLIDSVAEEASLSDKDITPQTLRHTMTAFALQNHDSIKTVQEKLGHTRRSTTRFIYEDVLKFTSSM